MLDGQIVKKGKVVFLFLHKRCKKMLKGVCLHVNSLDALELQAGATGPGEEVTCKPPFNQDGGAK
jgi:hypothetical protein